MHKRNSNTILGIVTVSTVIVGVGCSGPAANAKSHQQPLNIFSAEDPKTPGGPKFKGRPDQSAAGSMSMMSTDGEMPRREIIQAIPSLREDQRKVINKYFDQTQKAVGPVDDQIRSAEARLKELRAAKTAALTPNSQGAPPLEWHVTATSQTSWNVGSTTSTSRAWRLGSLSPSKSSWRLDSQNTGNSRSAKASAPSNFWAGPRWMEPSPANQSSHLALVALPPSALLAEVTNSNAPNSNMLNSNKPNSKTSNSKTSDTSNTGAKLCAKPSSDPLPLIHSALNPAQTEAADRLLSESELIAQIDAAKQTKKDKARTLADHIAVLLTPDQRSDLEGMRHGTLIITPPPAPPVDQPPLTAKNDKGKS